MTRKKGPSDQRPSALVREREARWGALRGARRLAPSPLRSAHTINAIVQAAAAQNTKNPRTAYG